MRVAILHETVKGGGLTRLNSAINAADSGDIRITLCDMGLPEGPRLRNSVAFRWRSLRSPMALAEVLPDDVDLLHIHGLPLAHAAVGARRLGLPSVVDSCDSWLRLAWSSRRDSGLANFAITAFSAAAAHAFAARFATTVTYISEADLRADRVLMRGVQSAVFENSIPKTLYALPRGGPFNGLVTVADFSYRPNALGLEWALTEVWPRLEETTWDLYGPTAPSVQLPAGVTYRGFRPYLDEIYAPNRVVFVPLLSGAGVKNKVLEGLAAGLPVVTTPEGVRGLQGLDDIVVRSSDPRVLADALQGAVGCRSTEVARRRNYTASFSSSALTGIWSNAIGR